MFHSDNSRIQIEYFFTKDEYGKFIEENNISYPFIYYLENGEWIKDKVATNLYQHNDEL